MKRTVETARQGKYKKLSSNSIPIGERKFGYGSYKNWQVRKVPWRYLIWALHNIPTLEPELQDYIMQLKERVRIFYYLAK